MNLVILNLSPKIYLNLNSKFKTKLVNVGGREGADCKNRG